MIDRIETFPLLGRKSHPVWGPPYGFVVKIVTSDGVVGYGESDTIPAVAEAAVNAPFLNPLMTGLAPLLKGTLAEPSAAWRKMSELVVQYGRDGVVLHAMAAIDIALWDIAGKRAGKPVCNLIGGAKRTRLRCYGTHPLARSLDETADYARRVVEMGFGAVKFGWAPLGEDAGTDEAIVRTLREAIGADVDLLVDGGMAWGAATAIARAERFRAYRIFWLEEVLQAYDIEAYAAVRKSAGIPIAAGEMAADSAELARLVNGGAVDILQIDVSRTGITAILSLLELASSQGVAIVNHTYGHVLNTAASLHVMAVAPNISLFECQTTPNDLRDALDGGQLRPRGGYVELPGGPGLGIEIDERALTAFHGH